MSNPKKNLLALIHAPGIGSIAINQLLELFPNLDELLTAKPQELEQRGVSIKIVQSIKSIDFHAVDADLQWAMQNHHHIVTLFDEEYPKLFHEIKGAPPILFCRGDLALLQSLQIAVVGTRNPTMSGAENAFEFARFLAANGFTVTSGLALGVDAKSHEGALAAQGKTVAVMGAGLEQTYPMSNRKLAENIVAGGGLLVSEFSTQVKARPEHFPRRNRLISGLSVGVLVIEAALQSGSLITAKYALEYGREVFAIPGSIHNPLTRGCHALIKQGAKLVETAADIFEELGELVVAVRLCQGVEATPDSSILAEMDRKLVECVGHETTPMDVVITKTGIAAEEVSARMVFLELEGYIASVSGGYVKSKRF